MVDLEAMLRDALGAERIEGLAQLSGGASRETWAFEADGRPLILQRDRPGGGLRRAATATEIAALRAADAAGVPVPSMLASGEDWFVVERVEGETIARRIQRDEPYAEARRRFAAQCGEALAAIHRIDVEEVPGLGEETMELWRGEYDSYRDPRPAFELAFRWLDRNPAPSPRRTLVHGDFRLGNVIVGSEGLRAVLDWEMTHAGDPVEDLGFLCVRSWRFGGPLPVGGLGTREDLVAAYEAASGTTVAPEALHRAEVYGTLRWGVIAMQQLHTHLTGAERSVELAAIGRRVCEIEHDVLALLEESLVGGEGTETIDPAGALEPAGAIDPAAESGAPRRERVGSGSPAAVEPAVGSASEQAERTERSEGSHEHSLRSETIGIDTPTAVELVEAVREYLERDVLPATTGRVSFHARVAMNVLATVERELTLGPGLVEQHGRRLAALGYGTDAELAAAIRAGSLDDRWDEVATAVGASVVDKLQVANPKYLVQP